MFWRGVEVVKYPNDLIIYQEIIWDTKPDIIIETGTKFGGSALYYASILDMLGNGEVLTIDFKQFEVPAHPRITYLIGDSISTEIINKVTEKIKRIQNPKVLVTLDSCHKKEHVKQELTLYKNFVSPGSYLIVEDTKLNGHPVHTPYKQDAGAGPMEAVIEFLEETSSFEVDKSKEKFLLTSNPNGFLKRL